MAQLAARLLHTQEVIGSSPVGPIFSFKKIDSISETAFAT